MSFFDIFRKWFTDKSVGGFGGSGISDEPPLFQGDIKELAVRLALSGNGLGQERKRIENYYKNKELPLRQQLNSENEYYEEQIAQLKTDAKAQKDIKNETSQEIKNLEEEQENLQQTIVGAREHINSAWQEILRHRYQKGKEFFDDRRKRIILSLEQDWDQIKNAINKQFEIESEIHKIQTTNYEQSKDELDRRADKCQEELNKVEQQIEVAGNQLDTLKRFGITRYSANFLLIVGIVSLAGAGSVVSNLLQDRSPGDDLITWFVKTSSFFINSMFSGEIPAWVRLAKPLIFIAIVSLFLLFFYCLIIISNKLVTKFDKNWDKDSAEPGEQESNQPKSRNNKKPRRIFPGNLEEFVRDSQGIKSYFDFIPLNIERRDYTRLIASFPYIFLIAAVIFLLSGRADGDTFTLATAYIGVIVVLLTTSCCVIYVTKVIEPRWLSYAARDEGQKGESSDPAKEDRRKRNPGFIRMNKEIFLLLVLLIVALLLASLMPVKSFSEFWTPGGGWDFKESVFKHAVWGALAIFVSLSSFGLAYGIVQQGLFHDFDRLEYKRQILRYWIEKYRSKPVIGSSRYFQYDYPDNWMMEQIDRLHDLEDGETWYELNEIFGDDYEFVSPPQDESDFMGVIGKKLLRRKKQLFRLLRRKNTPLQELRLTDFDIASEAAEKYFENRNKIVVAEEKHRKIIEKINEEKARILSAEQKRQDLDQKIVSLIREKNKTEAELLERLSRLREEKERDLMIFTAAYTVGSVANKLLRDEDILSSEIIKVPDEDEDESGAPPSVLPGIRSFPADALWTANRAIVTVMSHQGILDNQHYYKIREHDLLVPERDLIVINPDVSPVDETN